MKKILMLLLFWVTCHPIVSACDVCGASTDNVFGLLPMYKHFVGLRYQYRSFQVEHPPLFSFEEISYSKNYYHNAELWGRYSFLKNRFQAYAFIPFQHYRQNESGKLSLGQGFGDVRLQLQGLIVNSSDSAAYNLRHTLRAGVGIKLPTGKSSISTESWVLLAPNLQPGTGSVDIPLNLIYTLQYRKVGLNMELNYRINTSAPKSGYHFGNRLTTTIQAFLRQEIKTALLLPYVGVGWEQMQVDRKSGILQDFTGGQSLSATIGTEVFFNRVSFGLNMQVPVWQNLGEGYINAGWQGNLRFLYLF